jgi:hypothetical protein
LTEPHSNGREATYGSAVDLWGLTPAALSEVVGDQVVAKDWMRNMPDGSIEMRIKTQSGPWQTLRLIVGRPRKSDV